MGGIFGGEKISIDETPPPPQEDATEQIVAARTKQRRSIAASQERQRKSGRAQLQAPGLFSTFQRRQ